MTADADLRPQTIDRARALAARFYVHATMAAFDRCAIFDRTWHLVAHLCQLQHAGDHVIADLAGLPIIAVRGADNEIRVFHNVCRHRAGPIAQCDGLGAKLLRCRYHGWTYALDGVLKSAPEMQTAEDFHVEDIRLPQLQVRVWQGLIFASSGDDASGSNASGSNTVGSDTTSNASGSNTVGSDTTSFDALVESIDARLGTTRALEHYGHHQRVGYDVACNWKVYVDNYLEGYHLPHVHPALNRMLDYRSYVTETHGRHSLQWSPLESSNALYGDGDALYYWLWPNTMLNILPGRLQTNRIVPKGVDCCRVEFDF